MFEGFNLGDMGKMMEQLQEKAKEIQEQAKSVEFTAKAGGGMVTVTATVQAKWWISRSMIRCLKIKSLCRSF